MDEQKTNKKRSTQVSNVRNIYFFDKIFKLGVNSFLKKTAKKGREEGRPKNILML